LLELLLSPLLFEKSILVKSRLTIAKEVLSLELQSNSIQSLRKNTMTLLLKYFKWQTRQNSLETTNLQYAYNVLYKERYNL